MPFVITDGTTTKQAYEPPPAPQAKREYVPPERLSLEHFAQILSAVKSAIAQIPAPVVNVPKPEIKINSPVYVTAPEVKVPATTVNVPDGKAPVVNIEPASVTLQTNRPDKWKFTIERDELGRMTTIYAEAK